MLVWAVGAMFWFARRVVKGIVSIFALKPPYPILLVIRVWLGFEIRRHAISSKTLAPLRHPMKNKTKTNHESLFSRAFHQLHVFISSFDWFIELSASLVIGQNGYSCVSVMILDTKPL